MPELLDPDWEYFVPDPEIAEVMGCAAPEGFDGVIDWQEDRRGRGHASGLRFGRGNPDYARFRLAPPKADRPTARPRRCQWCEFSFYPRGSGSRFCSRECYAAGRQLEPRHCLTCGSLFRPPRSHSRYCSQRCSPSNQRSLPDRECRSCGKLFRPLADRTVYCSIRCVRHPGAPKRLASRVCLGCAGWFSPDRASRNYCSAPCYVPRGRAPKPAFRSLPVTLYEAKNYILAGAKFGDVFPHLDPVDCEAFREWFCRTPGVPRAPQSPPKKEATGDLCRECGGFMVRTGTCYTCQSCGTTSGGCS
jgi:hypothetical protein